jgi:hypothetical protein
LPPCERLGSWPARALDPGLPPLLISLSPFRLAHYIKAPPESRTALAAPQQLAVTLHLALLAHQPSTSLTPHCPLSATPSRFQMAPKRGRKDDDDDKGGPSKVQLRGLSWNSSAAQPAFLKNAMAALQGPKPARDLDEGSGRPAIPQRPEGEEEESDEDEWDMGRGEEAPAVVVLKEGRHIDRSEVDRIRAEGEFDESCFCCSLGDR